ncbi:MAG: PAS domain-containing hybrid sensor histidine kinase/response regulator, partial [Pseudomonadota bacterium]
MFDASTILTIALVYVGALFLIAWYGDQAARRRQPLDGRPILYALSIAIYCTSWTYFGSIGSAAKTGWDFVPVYLGPVLMFAFGWPLIVRVINIAKSQNITSIADFIAARYGKSPTVALVVTLVAVVGTLPYIALQLKAILITVETLQTSTDVLTAANAPRAAMLETGLLIASGLAIFALLFGTRHIDATEHQNGLMLAISAESIVKLAAFISVGLFVVLYAFGGPSGFIERLQAHPEVREVFSQAPDGVRWVTVTFLSFCCILLLPRQFHVTVVENYSEREVQRAAWQFPLYLFAINLFVIPIAAAGLITYSDTAADPDLFVVLVPMASDSQALTAFAFIGGLSAATAMVVVEAIAVAILICNGVIVPLLLRNRVLQSSSGDGVGRLLLNIRRVAIVAIVFLAFAVQQALGRAEALSSIGLISFAAIAQLAPAFFIGLFWRGGSERGAICAILAGFAMWAYTLLLPWIIKAGWLPEAILADGPLGLAFLKPQALFFLSFDPLTHGVAWSIVVNALTFVLVSRASPPKPVERMQSQLFTQTTSEALASPQRFKVWQSGVTVGDLRQTVSRYLGPDRAQRSFDDFAGDQGRPLDDRAEAGVPILRFSEHLLASAIGAASARLVLTLLLRRDASNDQSVLSLLDDASEALQHNRDLLQSAIDQVRHGLVVFDRDMRLVCWNRRFREILELPPEFGRVGVPLDRILRAMALRGDFGEADRDGVESLVSNRVTRLAVTRETFQERLVGNGRYIEVRTAAMPQGGIVTTFADITQRVAVSNALSQVNATLERRVEERTAELMSSNAALAIAKTRADSANRDKTRFVAAATHDILQPLNAARLYATSLRERDLDAEAERIARNIDLSLTSVEEIFGAITEISRIDAGRAEPDFVDMPLSELLENLAVEFAPVARAAKLELRIVPSSLWVRTDRRLMRRLLQNLVSNAIKYTPSGKVLIGARRRGESVEVQVLDTGVGIAGEHQELIFREFQRVEATAADVRGLGLGLSIVERISDLLGVKIGLSSATGSGSLFAVTMPRRAPGTLLTRVDAPPVPHRLSGTLVVCLDNEPVILEGMKTLLEGWGCAVIAAADAEEALALMSEIDGAPDVIFADYHLDNGTGDAAISQIRAARGADIPGAIITADHSDETEREIRAL